MTEKPVFLDTKNKISVCVVAVASFAFWYSIWHFVERLW